MRRLLGVKQSVTFIVLLPLTVYHVCLHGVNCKIQCPKNCADGKCRPNTHKCLACLAGFYGLTCGQTCHLNCLDGKCHQTSGKCTVGCVAGYKGVNCTEMCDSGTYGIGCIEECPRTCQGAVCDTKDGHCTNGCKTGRRGTHCQASCPPGLYGTDCVNKCSDTCNDLCDPVNGSCWGCHPGYTGFNCTEYKHTPRLGLDERRLWIIAVLLGIAMVVSVMYLAVNLCPKCQTQQANQPAKRGQSEEAQEAHNGEAIPTDVTDPITSSKTSPTTASHVSIGTLVL